MKKAVSLLASFTLAFSLLGAPAIGFADEGAADAQGAEQAAAAASTGISYASQERDSELLRQLELLEQNVFHAEAAPSTGSVEVRLTTVLTDGSVAGGLRAQLLGASQQVAAEGGFVAKSADELSEGGSVAKLEGVAPGSYVLRVSGEGFLSYEQAIEVKAAERSVVALVDKFSDATCSDGNGGTVSIDEYAGRGLLPYGDLNGDGVIGNSDALALLQAISTVRAGGQLSEADNAKFGMGLVRESDNPAATGHIDDLQVPDPVQSAGTQASSQGYGELQIVFGASDTSDAPEFRDDTATEDVDGITGGSGAEAQEPTDEAGLTEKLKTTEPMPVGLNAFQMLASLRGSQAQAGAVRAVKETSHMQAAVTEGSQIVLEAGQTLAEALFNDNGETVKMKLADETLPISDENPVQLAINANDTEMGAVTIAIPSDSPNAPTAGQVVVETSDGDLLTYDFAVSKATGQTSSMFDLRSNLFAPAGSERLSYFDSPASRSAEVSQTGDMITVDLGGQIPVKVITIKVTATSSNKLAEIAQVEFLNGMEDRIPEPELDIPTKLAATAGNKQIDLAWDQQRNVTGYEVEVSLSGSAKVVGTTKNSASITSFNSKELVNYTTYTLRVRSTNGDWRSPWSAPVTCTPKATSKPMAPAAPSVKGNYNSLTVTWKTAKDAETHSVYYKKRSESAFQKFVDQTSALTCTIPNLELSTTYDVYVTGTNEFGEGPASPTSSATTTPDKVKVPWYKLINRTAQNKDKGTSYPSNIESVSGDNGTDGGDPNSMVDGDYDTYYSGKKGGYHHGGTVTFTQPYDMDTIVLTGYQGQSLNIYSMQVQAWDANGNEIKPNGAAIKFSTSTYDSKTRTVMIRTAEKLQNVKKVRVAYQRSVGTSWSASTIAELAFYDTTLYSDTMNLWADEEHTMLRDGVTVAQIDALIAEANAADPDSGEFHPSQSLILAELANARTVAEAGALRAPIKVDPKLNVNAKFAKTGVGGLNGWQPLGVAAQSGDEINIYVGKKGETDRTVPLAFYVVQNHPDLSNGFSARLLPDEGAVKVGLNTLRIPDLTSINMEHGGSLYVEFGTAYNNTDQYTVRVSGGSEIPVLDLHLTTDADQRMSLVRDYVDEISSYDAASEHAAKNHNTQGGRADDAYDEQNCIANATDIVLADVMYSIPLSGVKRAIGLPDANATDAQKDAAATKLLTSLGAMDDMMTLFYQHKGFTKDSSMASVYGTNNSWPTLHQNIRYVRCSGTVFMYAAGNHIGIQWGSEGNLVNCGGVTLDDKGKWLDGIYFGWGVAHEIGHEINQSCYTYAEVTNNYYSQLTQATDSLANPRLRWVTYDPVYDRVSSGAKGAAAGKTGIAMYWQLHLAYDDGYNYQTYSTSEDMYDSLVFARIDAYARNTAAAPQAAVNGHALTLSGADKDNSLMRLACAATQKNLLAFFEAWGLTPDAETIAYASQWPVEERAIQYQTDALRLYRLGDFSESGDIYGLTSKQAEGAAAKATVSPSLSYTAIAGRPNTTTDQTIRVKLDNATVSNDILGYEVLRNGEVVGFLRANDFENCASDFTGSSAVFEDTINTVNNRVFKYEVRAIDKLLGQGEAIPAGEVKVSHPNSLSKAKWTATTNMAAEGVAANEGASVTGSNADGDIVYDNDELTAETETTAAHPVAKLIDGSTATSFSGSGASSDARVTIDFNETLTVVGIQTVGAAAGTPVIVETSADGTTWKTVKQAVLEPDANGIAKLYFERTGDTYLYGHDAALLRVTVPGSTGFAASEIDVLGPQGDDAEFLPNGIGVLSQTEELGTNESGKSVTIPAGSLVFVGTYTGNPAFNALLLYDQDGTVLGGSSDDGAIHAKEVIFAPPLAEGANLGDVEKGYWVYYIEPQYLTSDWRSKLTSVKAELYRVDNATTLEGQRLVADTLSVAMPTDLSNLDLSFGQVQTAAVDAQALAAEDAAAGQNLAVTGGEDAQSMGTPIEGDPSAAAGAVGGYSYDLAEVYGTSPSGNDSMGSPIYGGAAEQGSPLGTPIYDTGVTDYGTGTMGTPIYDNATPLAAPQQNDDNVFAKATLKGLRESLAKALKEVGSMSASLLR